MKISLNSKTSTGAIITFELIGDLWQKVANENSSYTFPTQNSDYLVAYGNSNKWVIEKYQNKITCSNLNFGEDPYIGKVKACYILKNFFGFNTCATQGETCLIYKIKYKIVRYGDMGTNQYTYKIINSPFVECSDSVFGDPASRLIKVCSFAYTES
jgi:hypothetical protein